MKCEMIILISPREIYNKIQFISGYYLTPIEMIRAHLMNTIFQRNTSAFLILLFKSWKIAEEFSCLENSIKIC